MMPPTMRLHVIDINTIRFDIKLVLLASGGELITTVNI